MQIAASWSHSLHIWSITSIARHPTDCQCFKRPFSLSTANSINSWILGARQTASSPNYIIIIEWACEHIRFFRRYRGIGHDLQCIVGSLRSHVCMPMAMNISSRKLEQDNHLYVISRLLWRLTSLSIKIKVIKPISTGTTAIVDSFSSNCLALKMKTHSNGTDKLHPHQIVNKNLNIYIYIFETVIFIPPSPWNLFYKPVGYFKLKCRFVDDIEVRTQYVQVRFCNRLQNPFFSLWFSFHAKSLSSSLYHSIKTFFWLN